MSEIEKTCVNCKYEHEEPQGIHCISCINNATENFEPREVCEWRLCDEEANVYDTSCRNPHIFLEGNPKDNNYEFCPYCGEKIKVVE